MNIRYFVTIPDINKKKSDKIGIFENTTANIPPTTTNTVTGTVKRFANIVYGEKVFVTRIINGIDPKSAINAVKIIGYLTFFLFTYENPETTANVHENDHNKPISPAENGFNESIAAASPSVLSESDFDSKTCEKISTADIINARLTE